MNKKTLAILLAFLLLVSVIGCFTKSGKADPIPAPPINHIYFRNNGIVDPSTSLIAEHNDTYTLLGDLTNTTIEIERDGIVFDGDGHSITGHGTSYDSAIAISNRLNVTINNLVVNQFGVGIQMDNASHNTLTGNVMTTSVAFQLASSDSNNIANNIVTQGYGTFGSGSNNLIIGNSFTGGLNGPGNGAGISFGGNNNTISHNSIIHGISIDLGNSMYNTISYNTIIGGSSESSGIILAKSSNNLVFDNIVKNIAGSDSSGLYVSYNSFNNVVFNNTFVNNTLAIMLGAQVANFVWNNVYNNSFYLNNFIGNIQNVWIAPGAPFNYWDNGLQGNYWSNFQGVDSNADGISESPYVIDGNNTDYHPLMALIDFSSQGSSAPSPSPSPVLPTPTLTPAPTPTPTIKGYFTANNATLIAAITIVAAVSICLGLSVYFKKRDKDK